MPIIEGSEEDIHKGLGPEWDERMREKERISKESDIPPKILQKQFAELCFDFGIELDEVTSEYEQILNEKGQNAPELKDADKSSLYKVEIPANRYDLLCLEGLLRSLRIFLEFEQAPQYRTITPPDNEIITLRVRKDTKQIRQYIVAAVLRNVTFTEKSYDSFIKLQEKLHFNICRRRTLVAIGTHDLDTLKAPFEYDARAPKNIQFKALREEKEMNAAELFDEYRTRAVCPLKPYVPIIENSPVYPVIYDSNNVVLSLPPVINGEHSKITLNTRNVFIESTATDLTKARIVINTICAMFSQYCSNPFEIEQVNIVYDEPVISGDGSSLSSYLSPDFTPTPFITTQSYINKGLGTKFSRDEIINLLSKMSLNASNNILDSDINELNKRKHFDIDYKEIDSNDIIICRPPITRSDILHEVDIMEDVAIGFGYNNIEKRLPSRSTTGSQQVINNLSDKIRMCVAMSGYCEVLNWALISKNENYNKMRIEDKGIAIEVGNPKTNEFEICRTNLLPGVLRTLSENVGHVALPLSLFEVGDVVLCDERENVKARNERRLCALICGTQESGLEQIHGLLDRLMSQNKILFLSQDEIISKYNNKWPNSNTGRFYSLIESDRNTFFPKRQAAILVDGKVIGYFGMLHPKVANNFNVMKNDNILVSALEITLHAFL